MTQKKLIPALSPSGWITDPANALTRMNALFYLNDASGLNVSENFSFMDMVRDHLHESDLRGSIQRYLTNYFMTVFTDVSVQVSQYDHLDNTYDIGYGVSVVYNGVRHDLATIVNREYRTISIMNQLGDNKPTKTVYEFLDNFTQPYKEERYD